ALREQRRIDRGGALHRGHARPDLALREVAHRIAEQLLFLGELGEGGRHLTRRSLIRRTNLSPDHTSSTAATFTSTRPCASPITRITSSVRSVATPDTFFGHELHSLPAGATACASVEIGRAHV